MNKNLFISITEAGYNTIRKKLVRNSLLLLVIIDCFHRAWKHKKENHPQNKLGLKQWQFVFSPMEYEKYGLTKTKKSKLNRVLKKREQRGVIKKTNRKTFYRRANIYQFLPNDIIKIRDGNKK